MQFLLAVRGCTQDNSVYTPVVPLNVKCGAQALGGAGLNAVPGASGMGAAGAFGGLGGVSGLSDPAAAAAGPQDGRKKRNSADSARCGLWATLAAAAGGAAAVLVL
jgi:hypothetical protein